VPSANIFAASDKRYSFDTFAENIGLDLDSPEVLRLEEWLTNSPYAECPNRVGIPLAVG
jgi:hypothetical protein